jgi:hypothetical protein
VSVTGHGMNVSLGRNTQPCSKVTGTQGNKTTRVKLRFRQGCQVRKIKM